MPFFNSTQQIRILIVVFFSLLVCPFHVVLADVQNKSFYEQITSNVSRIYEHQSLCTPGGGWAEEKNVSLGSAFVVADHRTADAPVDYIVTARHVVENHYDLFARFQTADNKDKAILRLPRGLWVFHPQAASDETFPIDVAV